MYEYIIGSGSQDGRILFKKLKKKDKIIKIYRNRLIINNKKYVFNPQNKKIYIKLFERYKPKKIYYFFTFHLPESKRNKNNINFDKYFKFNFVIFKIILNSIVGLNLNPKIFYSSSSFIYNGYIKKKINEKTLPKPNCEYGITKLLAMNLINYYREKHKLFIITGILFNHESGYRNKNFFIPYVIDKIINNKTDIINIKMGFRDWSDAEDVVRAIIFLMNKGKPENYLICSGKLLSTFQATELIKKELKKKLEFNIIPTKNILQISGSNKKLLSLGFEFKYTFNKMIKRLYTKINE